MENGTRLPQSWALGGRTRVRDARLAVCLILAGLFFHLTGRAAEFVPEYDVKAAFLFNIAKLAQWPAQSFEDSSSPLVIGVLGRDPFGGSLDRVVAGRQIDGRQVIVRRGNSAAEFRGAHLVFIPDSEANRADSLAQQLENMHVLTVGDSPEIGSSTAISFIPSNGKIAFTVSMPAANRAGVRLSSKLLNLAKSVRTSSGSTTARQ